MKNNCLLIVFIVFTISAFGQNIGTSKSKRKVSGFLGKKMGIAFSFNGLYRDGPGRSYSPEEEIKSGKGISAVWEFEGSLVITPQTSLSVNVGSFNTSSLLDNPNFGGRDIIWEALVDHKRVTEKLISFNGTPIVRDNYFGLKYTVYPKIKGGLAPIGFYWEASINIHFIYMDANHMTLNVLRTNIYPQVHGVAEINSSEALISTWDFRLNFGDATPINDNFILRYGLGGRILFPTSIKHYEKEHPAFIALIEEVEKEIRIAYLIDFRIGLQYVF